MALEKRPEVFKLSDGSKYWEQEYESFYLKAYVPVNELDGAVNNYGFKAPLLLVFEENRSERDGAVKFATQSGLAQIAAEHDGAVLFIYPKADGGWREAEASLYADVIAEVRMDTVYSDGIDEFHDFLAGKFRGYFIRGAKFRADIYSFGASADFVATKLLKTAEGEYLWGPGEITPAVCSMERLSVMPVIERKDIAVVSVGNSKEINDAFADCEHLLIKEKADYVKDFKEFTGRYKMWCGTQQTEPDLLALGMAEEAGAVIVKTSANNMGQYKDQPTHTVGYFAYYNKGLFDKGPAPLLIGLHGGGDSSMYLTYVSGWWELAHDHDILYVAIENHLDVTAAELIDVIDELKNRYSIDEERIYAGGFSMGSGKTQDLYMEFPSYFAGFMPCSALFPMKDNPFSRPLNGKINEDTAVALFYSGGADSPLPELPCQAESCLDRAKYLARVNELKADFESLSFEERDKWEDPVWGIPGDRTEVLHDDSRGSDLIINYYDSTDGVCRTAFASVSSQQHECRHHSVENAWNFVSRFKRKSN